MKPIRPRQLLPLLLIVLAACKPPAAPEPPPAAPPAPEPAAAPAPAPAETIAGWQLGATVPATQVIEEPTAADPVRAFSFDAPPGPAAHQYFGMITVTDDRRIASIMLTYSAADEAFVRTLRADLQKKFGYRGPKETVLGPAELFGTPERPVQFMTDAQLVTIDYQDQALLEQARREQRARRVAAQPVPPKPRPAKP